MAFAVQRLAAAPTLVTSTARTGLSSKASFHELANAGCKRDRGESKTQSRRHLSSQPCAVGRCIETGEFAAASKMCIRMQPSGGLGKHFCKRLQGMPMRQSHRPVHTNAVRAYSHPANPAKRPYTAVLIIPTGVGAAIGGFAGDALPVARTIASVVDCLITHPNVMNGAMLYWPLPNTLYVEGFGLDAFARGEWALAPVHQNRIGVVLDAAIEPDLRLRHLQVADAARATLGIDVAGAVVTSSPLGVEKWIDERTGQSTGRLGNPDALLDAVEYLVRERDVDAIAVIGRFPDDAEEELVDYRQGQGVDALAGVEAVISHMVVERFGIPCAHAPALELLSLQEVSPRSAAEEIGYTFFPCVLAGLSRAPQFVPRNSPVDQQSRPVHQRHYPVDRQDNRPVEVGESPVERRNEPVEEPSSTSTAEQNGSASQRDNSAAGFGLNGWVNRQNGEGLAGTVLGEDVDAVIVPIDACGGDGTLAFARGVRGRKPPLIIAVGENETVLEDTPEKLGIKAIRVANYWEAIGVLAAHKAGVRPEALRKDGTGALLLNEIPPKLSVVPGRDGREDGHEPLLAQSLGESAVEYAVR